MSGSMAGYVKKITKNRFFANISETIYCTEINVQIKNKVNKIFRSLVF